MLEPHKQAEIDTRTAEFMAHEASKPFGWGSEHWGRWQTVVEALARLGVDPPARRALGARGRVRGRRHGGLLPAGPFRRRTRVRRASPIDAPGAGGVARG